MKTRFKIILIVAFFVILILGWAPWITDEFALNKVKSNPNFIKQHSPYGGIKDQEIKISWLPFGKGVFTYEGLWYVTFFGFVV